MHTIDMDTIKILEARQNFLSGKLSLGRMDINSFSAKELGALGEATNFIRWMINNSSDDMVQKVTEKYKQENSNTMNKKTGEENRIETNDNKGDLLPLQPNVFHENKSRNNKLQITITEDDGVNFIKLEVLRRRMAGLPWKRVSYIRMTVYKLEKVLKKIHALINAKNGEASSGPPVYDNQEKSPRSPEAFS